MKYKDLTDHIEYFSNVENNFGKWVYPSGKNEKVTVCPYVEYSREVSVFSLKISFHICAEPDLFVKNYLNCPKIKELGRTDDISAVASSMTMKDIIAFLTYFVRGERFCDGHMLSLCESGAVGHVLKRLKQIDKKGTLYKKIEFSCGVWSPLCVEIEFDTDNCNCVTGKWNGYGSGDKESHECHFAETEFFLNELSKIHLNKWKAEYLPEKAIFDGDEWELTLTSLSGKVRHIYGHQTYPDEYYKLIKLMGTIDPSIAEYYDFEEIK